MIEHVFISKTEEERRKNVTQILIDLENDLQGKNKNELEYLLTNAV